MLRSTIFVAAAAAAAADGGRVTIQECQAGWVPETFVLTTPAPGPTTVVSSDGQCLGFDATSLLVQACSGSNQQMWTFHPDGTVESVGTPGQCWNVIGGGTGAGTTVGMYECGVVRSGSRTAAALNLGVAANDVFAPLPGQKQILANESGLCVSTAAPPFNCNGDECCSLNGVWNGASCTCYKPWTGPNCTVLDVLPPPPIQGYGMAPNLTSWGGNIAFYGGQYHLYVAEMANHCPLTTWGSNSRCAHAVSATPQGPFTKVDVAVDIWCHNPQVVMFQNGSSTVFALFHIGTGSGGNPKNCTPPEGGEEEAWAVDAMEDAEAAAGSALHIATNPAGPWTPVQPAPPSCNNPAPMLHPNGTWFLLCDSSTLYSAPSLYGPWTQITRLSWQNGVPGNYEDAFLWLDPRGYWHVIFHVYTTDIPNTCKNSTVSAHIYSRDGLKWLSSPISPFGTIVNFTDGSTMVVSTRERPKMLFNAAGDPTHLINGVCGGSSWCGNEGTPCVNCKYNYWDFTLVQPLNV